LSCFKTIVAAVEMMSRTTDGPWLQAPQHQRPAEIGITLAR
jgi:hypothetical protein